MATKKPEGEKSVDEQVSSIAGGDLMTASPQGPEVDVFRVLIQRDETTKLSVDVPEYEIAVLEAVHGADKIEVGDPAGTRRLDSDDAEQEYQRLMRKYETRNDANPVVTAYGNDPARLASVMGLEFNRNRGARAKAQMKQSLNVDHSKK